MKTPKTFISNRLFELGRTSISKPIEDGVEFYHRKISWWITIYGVRFKKVGYYIMLKKICF